MGGELWQFYLRRLLALGKKEVFIKAYKESRNEELFFRYVELLAGKNIGKAFEALRNAKHDYSEEFYNRIDRLFEKNQGLMKKRRLDREYKLWTLIRDYHKVRYRVLINRSAAWFGKNGRPKDIYSWRGRLYSAMANTRRREHSSAVQIYETLEKYSAELQLENGDLYNLYRWAGYSFAALGKNDESIEMYLKGASFFRDVEGTRSADFVYYAADMARLDGKSEKALELYERIRTQYPDYHRIELVDFLSFWIGYRQKNFEVSGRILKNIASRNSPESYYYRRARYWQSRVLGKAGLEKEEEAILKEVAIDNPATYYGAMAATRLKQRGISLGKVKKSGERKKMSDFRLPETAWTMLLFFHKEMSMLKHFLPVVKKAVLDRGGEADRVALSYVAKKMGYFSLSARLIRSVPTLSSSSMEYIKLQYPIGFEAEISAHADFYDVPMLFVCSIARQESLFNTAAVSKSYAIGLLQLLPSTAQLLANRERYGKVTVQNLKKPLTNIRFGIKFLGMLINRFDGSLPLAAASYNAGPGKIDRWIKRNGHMEIDEFVEDIPIFQTRAYVKKVMRNYSMYHYLYNGKVLDSIKMKLP